MLHLPEVLKCFYLVSVKNTLRKYFSILLTAVLLLPFGIQTIHAFKHHESNFCVAKKVKHIHAQKPDCSVYHQSINQHIIDFHTDFSFIHSFRECAVRIPAYKTAFHIVLKLKSPRAPPVSC